MNDREPGIVYYRGPKRPWDRRFWTIIVFVAAAIGGVMAYGESASSDDKSSTHGTTETPPSAMDAKRP